MKYIMRSKKTTHWLRWVPAFPPYVWYFFLVFWNLTRVLCLHRNRNKIWMFHLKYFISNCTENIFKRFHFYQVTHHRILFNSSHHRFLNKNISIFRIMFFESSLKQNASNDMIILKSLVLTYFLKRPNQ